jgi:hypothetical protein
MTYGVATLTAFSLARGQPFILESTARYLGATLYLALFAQKARPRSQLRG